MTKKHLEKLTLQFDDEVRVLEGDDAQQWYDINVSLVALASVHGRQFTELDWTITERISSDKKRKRTSAKCVKRS